MRVAIVLALLLSARGVRADNGDRWDGTTIALQSTAATGASVIATIGLICLAAAIGGTCDKPRYAAVLTGLGLGLTLLSVQAIGDSLDGTGSIGGTTLGMAVGVGVGFGGTLALVRAKHRSPLVLVAMGVPIVVGSVL